MPCPWNRSKESISAKIYHDLQLNVRLFSGNELETRTKALTSNFASAFSFRARDPPSLTSAGDFNRFFVFLLIFT